MSACVCWMLGMRPRARGVGWCEPLPQAQAENLKPLSLPSSQLSPGPRSRESWSMVTSSVFVLWLRQMFPAAGHSASTAYFQAHCYPPQASGCQPRSVRAVAGGHSSLMFLLLQIWVKLPSVFWKLRLASGGVGECWVDGAVEEAQAAEPEAWLCCVM